MNEKVSTVTLSGTVDKIIVSALPNVPDKAQITVAGSELLYRELRIDNALTNQEGGDASLKQGQNVEVTIEAHTEDTRGKEWYPLYQSAVDRIERG